MNNTSLRLAGAFVALACFSPLAHAGPRPADNSGGTGQGQQHRDPKKAATEFIAKFDKDGDKAVNADELAAGLQTMRQKVAEHRGQAAGRRKQQSGDSENSGGQRAGGEHGTPADHAKMMIEKFDKNGDQKLDAEELAAAFAAIREHAAARRGGAGQKGGTPSTQ